MAWIYAVRKGHAPGIYHDVEEYQKAIDGFSGAEGRRFQDEEAARRYLAGETPTKKGIYAVRRGRVPGIYHSA
ncbi:MAG: viroplasmin family protein, partial [Schwartzia sp.]|nr:viroplasmin family protein [Schwartzia sp. (in: firmicutes)]